MHPKLQYFAPQKGLSRLAGWLANSEIPWLKNRLISYFVNRYPVNMQEAIEPNPFAYSSYNAFFTRALLPTARNMASNPNDFVSPADGCISQLGKINDGQLIQAKSHHFTCRDLLGGNTELASLFHEGHFLTVYLCPSDYHRVHMPFDGELTKMIYIPGQLFSVNQRTTRTVPNLFARNERVVAVFKTSAGMMAVILVGAMIVGSIETVWAGTVAPSHVDPPHTWDYSSPIYLKRGEEMGRFKLGSTVIVLMQNPALQFDAELNADSPVLLGQRLATV